MGFVSNDYRSLALPPSLRCTFGPPLNNGLPRLCHRALPLVSSPEVGSRFYGAILSDLWCQKAHASSILLYLRVFPARGQGVFLKKGSSYAENRRMRSICYSVIIIKYLLLHPIAGYIFYFPPQAIQTRCNQRSDPVLALLL